MEYGLQLFSVRDMTGADLEGALKAVAELGYSSVEYAGFFGHSAEQVAAWQEKYGLCCSGTHSGTAELLPEIIDQFFVPSSKSSENTTFPLDDLIVRLSYKVCPLAWKNPRFTLVSTTPDGTVNS